ncbi:hypothetical protein D0Z07_2174 [Hyphodiscus hymeniophilus]|uniref:Phytanoyl-CoA dioxygenase n=1 Tax=Hyphodiscus hymeniophilus TaxID=353542 RepID=A0A9P7AZS2_9HELO|nr:hypothetical protein D0Z07_2174 [Hyphodiscus hymeniophilus]
MPSKIASPTEKSYSALTPEDVAQWMKYGYVIIRNAFSRQQAEDRMEKLWIRLGYDPNDANTWVLERVNMPSHSRVSFSTFAPKAWQAICELSGGYDRLDESRLPTFGDDFICNFGKEEYVGQTINPHTFDNWHVDGDFFKHFLDSPEQGMLVIPLYSDIAPGGGGTVICPDGMRVIAKHLAEHPEGVSPRMVPVGEKPTHKGLDWFIEKIQDFPKDSFHEMTGNIGDVVLMHPLMLHSASKNILRIPRIITNPRITMKEPFRFAREKPDDYSLIELKTLSLLGVDSLDYKITGQRELLNPTRTKIHARMKEQENLRISGRLGAVNLDKVYDINRLEDEVE